MKKVILAVLIFSKSIFCVECAEIDFKPGISLFSTGSFFHQEYRESSSLAPIDLNLILKLSNNFNLESGLSYNPRIQKAEIPDYLSNLIPFEIINIYASLFIYPEYSIKFANSTVYFNIGPTFDFLINSIQTQFNATTTSRDNNFPFVLGLNQAIGYKVKIDNFLIGIENQYSSNLTKIYRYNSSVVYLRTIAFKIIIGYSL